MTRFSQSKALLRRRFFFFGAVGFGFRHVEVDIGKVGLPGLSFESVIAHHAGIGEQRPAVLEFFLLGAGGRRRHAGIEVRQVGFYGLFERWGDDAIIEMRRPALSAIFLGSTGGIRLGQVELEVGLVDTFRFSFERIADDIAGIERPDRVGKQMTVFLLNQANGLVAGTYIYRGHTLGDTCNDNFVC